MTNKLSFLNETLLWEIVCLILTSLYLIVHWNDTVTVGTGLISLFWVELVYLIYTNFQNRNDT